MEELDLLADQLTIEKRNLEEAKKLCSDLEKEIASVKERGVLEKDQHDVLLDRFDDLTRETANLMKENNAKVKKLREQHKKDASKPANNDKKKKDVKKKK